MQANDPETVARRLHVLDKMSSQVAAIFGLSLALIVATLVVFTYLDRSHSLTNHLEAEGRVSALSISEACAQYIPLGDLAGIEQMLFYFGTDVDIRTILVTNAKGQLLSKMNRSRDGKVSMVYEQATLLPPSVVAFKREEYLDHLTFWAPVVSKELIGWVKLDYSLLRLGEARVAMLKQCVISGTFAFVVGVLLLHFFFRPRLAVIKRVAERAQQMGRSPHPILAEDNLSLETRLLTTALNKASVDLYTQTEQIRQDRERIRLLLDSVPVAVLGTDLKGKCIFHNPMCATVCGYPQEKILLGRELGELLLDVNLPAADNPYTAIHKETALKKNDGTQAPCELWMHPIEREQTCVGHLITFVDISERRNAEQQKSQLEKQLQKSQRMLAIGHLTGGIAHDFNNILTSILGYARLATNASAGHMDDKLHDYMSEILLGAERARRLVKQMLAFGRADSGSPKLLHPADTVSEIVRMVRPMLPSTLEIDAGRAQSDLTVMADPVQLQQILMNLLLNASDAMNGQGRVEVGVEVCRLQQCHCMACHENFAGDFVALQVKDTGGGIDASLLTRIFEPFFTTKEIGKGSGLGLSMVHGLVHKNRGHLLVESTLGRGTQFQVLLPLDENTIDDRTAHETEAGGTSPVSGRNRERPAHILVVDDEESVARFIRDLLEIKGYEISMETSSVTAYEKFMRTPGKFDLVVTDQTMPNITGYELADRFLKVRPDLPIILCTGYSEQVSRERALQLGIKSYHEKPIDIASFCTTISKLLDT